MNRTLRAALFLVFAVTGASALILQVVWQRVISMHAGVDLYSITTVVAAFLGGIGLGSISGGWLADRLGPRKSILTFSLSNAGIGAFSLISIWLFYDVYRDSIVPLESEGVVSFLFHFALLLIPTFLMGLSLPLVSRGVVGHIEDAGPLIGRLYAANTVGAASGAAVSGWFLLGNLGFEGSVRVAASLNLGAALVVLALWKSISERADYPAGTSPHGNTAESRGRGAGGWIILYAITGAIALGLEVVFFRIVDGVIRSNSYTFAHVLSLYLVLFAAGAALGARTLRKRKPNPARAFLLLQSLVGLSALLGPLLLIRAPRLAGLGNEAHSYFSSHGYLDGFSLNNAGDYAKLGFAYLVAPLLLMGLPVLCMGASFPFVQALVASDLGHLGRRTGLLLFGNVAGNVVGTLLTGFVLIDAFGSFGTLRILGSVLITAAIAGAWLSRGQKRGLAVALALVILMVVGAFAAPSNEAAWAFMHAAPLDQIDVEEDSSCANALKQTEGFSEMYVNAASQNGYPFDDFHVLIGLTPVLMHDSPARGLAVGLGIGATTYGLMQDPRVDLVETVEVCGKEIDLLRTLSHENAWELEFMFEDQRIDLLVGDGRKHLLRASRELDVVTIDTLRPTSAFSGNLYSVEFYELVASKLREGGLIAQWAPTSRALNSLQSVFPHVVQFSVESYNNSVFVVGSKNPFTFDRAGVLGRFDALGPELRFSESQAQSLRHFFESVEPQSAPPANARSDQLNRDLFPRDEYFLNN
ncbi:MAG TPA: fused MFS/spermidine synthase [Actinomycetota bacterium]|nr:fused MFS/spermidine synthase [Actinomycetota bacterium]